MPQLSLSTDCSNRSTRAVPFPKGGRWCLLLELSVVVSGACDNHCSSASAPTAQNSHNQQLATRETFLEGSVAKEPLSWAKVSGDPAVTKRCFINSELVHLPAFFQDSTFLHLKIGMFAPQNWSRGGSIQVAQPTAAAQSCLSQKLSQFEAWATKNKQL